MKWKATWKYLPVNYNADLGKVENLTQRTVFRNNLNGEKLKLKFSNKYGRVPLAIEKVTVARKDAAGQMRDCCIITKGGKETIVLAPGEEFYSDAVEWNVRAGEDILLFLYLKERQVIQCSASVWSTQTTRTQYYPGGYRLETGTDGWKESREIYPYVDADVNKADIIAGVTEILLYTEEQVKTIALFGDSITHMSYFSDALMNRILQEMPGRVSVVNYGIGGNRILHDASHAPALVGEGSCFGPAGVSRFEEDLFGEDAPDLILLLEGVNDIMHPYVFQHPNEIVSAQELIQGISRMIDVAHRHERPIFVGTVMPFWNEEYTSWIEEGDRIRTALNSWIRQTAKADGVLDYDRAAANPEQPDRMKDGIHIGDGLHPNTRGGELMAETAFRLMQEKAVL